LVCGQWALVLSNQIHSFVVPQDAVVWVAVFSEEYVPAFVAQTKGMQGTAPVFWVSEPVSALVEHTLMTEEAGRLMKKACFYAVCDEYLTQVPLETRQDKSNFLVGQLLDWISVNYTENISLKMAAELFGYEYHYLSRLLNRNYAISFTELLASYRVEHAEKLLRETSLPATRIAELSGFQSIRSFNLAFKKMTGQTPNNYRACD
jgi:AraC-like DNA-binding protein